MYSSPQIVVSGVPACVTVTVSHCNYPYVVLFYRTCTCSISLYLRVGDLLTAEHLVSEWINEESNYNNTSYWSVVDLCVSKILLPVGGSEKVEDFLAKSCIISSERKQVFVNDE